MKPGINSWIDKSFNTSILNKNRIQWVDYLRGIAIILVVYRHTLIGIERTGLYIPDYLVEANMVFYSFRMPLFFIIAGIFIGKSLAKNQKSNLIKIKFENLIYPYLIWCGIQISLQILFNSYTNSNRSFIDYTYMFYHPRSLDQFWYLPALFNTSLLFILLSNYKLKLIIHFLFACTLYFASPFFREISIISDTFEFYIFFVIGDIISKLFFDKKFLEKFNKPTILLLLIPVFILTQIIYLGKNEYYYLNNSFGQCQFLFIALIGCLTMFSIACLLQRHKLFSFLRVIGFHSLYIYVMHVLVIAFMRIVLTKIFGITDSITLLGIGVIIGIIFPIMIYNRFIKDGYFWFLFHLKKKTRSD